MTKRKRTKAEAHLPRRNKLKSRTLWGLAVMTALAMGLVAVMPGSAQIRRAAQPEPEIDIQSYRADVEVNPEDQTLRGIVTIDFVPNADMSTLTFELNNALELHTVTDGNGDPVAGQRNGADMTVRLLPTTPFAAGQPAKLVFNYAGQLTGEEESPVWGIKFAAIHPDYAYFMYPSRWLPISGYTTDRFTMDLRVTTPAGFQVIGSGTPTLLNRRQVLAELAEMAGTLGANISFGSVSGSVGGPVSRTATTVVDESDRPSNRPVLRRRTGDENEQRIAAEKAEAAGQSPAAGAEEPYATPEPNPTEQATADISFAVDATSSDAASSNATSSTGADAGDGALISVDAVGNAEPELPPDDGKITTQFVYDHRSFPGSFAVARGTGTAFTAEGVKSTFYFRESKDKASAYANTIGEAESYLSGIFGPLPEPELTVVETEVGSPNGYAAPGILFLSPTAMAGSDVNKSTVVNNVARQWFGVIVSGTTRNHLWIENGMARYAEILYTEEFDGKGAMHDAVHQSYVEALTVEQPPMVQASRLEDYSPEYWALTAGKGAAVLNMLRAVVGDDAFFKTLRRVPDQFRYNSMDTFDFRDVAESFSDQPLNGFFLQWTESSGAPEFTMEYTVFRTTDGFRINGRIMQDLDLFRMPVNLRIETEGNPEDKQVIVSGTSSEFAVETFGKPIDVVLDPDGEVLRYDDQMRVDVAIKRGEQFAQISEFLKAIDEYERALQVKRNSSLANYRVGEVYFLQGNLQEAATRFRDALGGDLQPAWVEVWARINLGQIFDITDQRERAINEYRQALRTRDNTAGALEVAQKYLDEPYQRERDRF